MFDQGEYSVQEYTSRRSDSVYSTNTLVIVIFGFSPLSRTCSSRSQQPPYFQTDRTPVIFTGDLITHFRLYSESFVEITSRSKRLLILLRFESMICLLKRVTHFSFVLLQMSNCTDSESPPAKKARTEANGTHCTSNSSETENLVSEE